MKISILIMVLIITILLVISKFQWKHDININGIEFTKVQYQKNGKDTSYIYGQLKQTSIINNYYCAADWIKLSKDFKVLEFCLDKDSELKNLHLKKGTWIFLNTPYTICVLPNSTIIQEYLCKGGGGKKGIQTSFYKTGELHTFFTPENITINNLLCKGGNLNYIELYKNGKLKQCTLAKAQSINEKNYKKNTIIRFNKKQEIIKED